MNDPPSAMARYTAFIIGSAMTAVAAGRIKLPLNLVQCHKITTVLEFTVRAIAIDSRRLHLNFIGVAVIAERAFMTG